MPHVGHAATIGWCPALTLLLCPPTTATLPRTRWDRSALADARDMILDCLRAGPPGRYVLQAAIASLYAEAPTYEQTDWPQIVALYDAERAFLAEQIADHTHRG